MAWTNIPNANLAAGAPIRSVDLLALRDNISAVANADSGAPKIVNAAISSGIVNSLNGQTGAITNTGFNVIGSYIAGGNSANANVNSTYATPQVMNANWDSENNRYSPQQSYSSTSGTWRMMGYCGFGLSATGGCAVLFVRIS
jgi:hypothetical protein